MWTTELPVAAAAYEGFSDIHHDGVGGQVVLAGASSGQLHVVALDDLSGQPKWSLAQGNPLGTTIVEATALDGAGNLYVLCRVAPPESHDYSVYLYSFDAGGAERFVEPIQPEGLNWLPWTVHVDGLLNVYVAGDGCFDPCPHDIDFVVMKYSQLPTVEAVASKVQGLVTNETLNNGEGHSLVAKLDGAAAAMERGNGAAARGQLEAFIAAAQALMTSGRLTPEEAGELLTAATGLLDSL